MAVTFKICLYLTSLYGINKIHRRRTGTSHATEQNQLFELAGKFSMIHLGVDDAK